VLDDGTRNSDRVRVVATERVRFLFEVSRVGD